MLLVFKFLLMLVFMCVAAIGVLLFLANTFIALRNTEEENERRGVM